MFSLGYYCCMPCVPYVAGVVECSVEFYHTGVVECSVEFYHTGVVECSV